MSKKEEYIKQIYSKLANQIVDNTYNWRKMAIFTYREKYGKFKMIPEILAMSIANELWVNHNIRSVVMINTDNIKLGNLVEVARELNIRKNIFKFGVDSGKYQFLPEAKIKINKISRKPTLFTKIVRGMAPEKSEKIDEKEFSEIKSIDDLSAKLIESLKPPSLNETIGTRIKEKAKNNKMATIMEIIGIVGGAVIQPFVAAPQGVKMMREIVDILKIRKKEFYKEWEKAIKTSFQPQLINKLFSQKEDSSLLNGIKQNGFIIILNSTTGTIYEAFSYYLLYSTIETLVNEIGEGAGILTNSENLAQLPVVGESIRCELENERSIKMTYIFENEKIIDANKLEKYINDKVILFDTKASILTKLFLNQKATEVGELIYYLAKAKKHLKYMEIPMLIRNYGLKGKWEIRTIPMEIGLKAWLKRILRKLIDKVIGQYI